MDAAVEAARREAKASYLPVENPVLDTDLVNDLRSASTCCRRKYA